MSILCECGEEQSYWSADHFTCDNCGWYVANFGDGRATEGHDDRFRDERNSDTISLIFDDIEREHFKGADMLQEKVEQAISIAETNGATDIVATMEFKDGGVEIEIFLHLPVSKPGCLQMKEMKLAVDTGEQILKATFDTEREQVFSMKMARQHGEDILLLSFWL